MSWIGSVPQVLNFLYWGSNNFWFGLGCPAHCSGSLGYTLAILSAGFGFGALVTLYAFRTSLFLPSVLPVPSGPSPPNSPRGLVARPAALELRGYLHER